MVAITQPHDAPAKPAIDAAALLGAAAKKTKGASAHLNFTEQPALVTAERWLALSVQKDEAERDMDLLADQILSAVRPWHRETCQRRRTFDGTVNLTTPAGVLRVSFQNRYSKIPLDREPELRAAVGDDYDRLFKRHVALKVKKDVADDPQRLEQLVVSLAESIGADNFAACFEVEQSLSPTEVFTQTSCQLSEETRTALETAGVKQTIGFAKGKAA